MPQDYRLEDYNQGLEVIVRMYVANSSLHIQHLEIELCFNIMLPTFNKDKASLN